MDDGHNTSLALVLSLPPGFGPLQDDGGYSNGGGDGDGDEYGNNDGRRAQQQ